jgi:hypothetical protein
MYFKMTSTLKNNRNHTSKHASSKSTFLKNITDTSIVIIIQHNLLFIHLKNMYIIMEILHCYILFTI